jgi:hypothetical protein
MFTAYHPETDKSSKCTNKTVIQCIHFAVEHDQLGWVKALPKIRFDIMNTINCSIGFTPFQLHFGRSPRILLLNFEIVLSIRSSAGYGMISQQEEILYSFCLFCYSLIYKVLILHWPNVTIFTFVSTLHLLFHYLHSSLPNFLDLRT